MSNHLQAVLPAYPMQINSRRTGEVPKTDAFEHCPQVAPEKNEGHRRVLPYLKPLQNGPHRRTACTRAPKTGRAPIHVGSPVQALGQSGEGKEVDDATVAPHHQRITWVATAEQTGCQARVSHEKRVQSACHIPTPNASELCARDKVSSPHI